MKQPARPAFGGTDLLFMLGLTLLFAPFFLLPEALALYKELTAAHGLLLSFAKFAVLATLGELLALRLRTGRYYQPGFGVLSRAVVWGCLGIAIAIAFTIFAQGAPAALRGLGLAISPTVLQGPLGLQKVLVAFWISLTMNLTFAPVMMTVHKITDEHILQQGGRLRGLCQPIPVGQILAALDWSVLWGFVFKKTIPLFWIPAHTLTFLLPAEYRVLFAAVLGVVLGMLLAAASLMGRDKTGGSARA